MSGRVSLTRFGLIRHARTVWNREKRVQGQSDTPLTPGGERQASVWGQKLRQYQWDRIITSDIGRSWQTATGLNAFLQVPVSSDPGLREQDWGNWTGKTLKQIRKEDPGLLAAQENAGWNFCPPGGEDRNSVWQRSHQTLMQSAKRWPGETILIVTHEGVIKSILYRHCNRRFIPTEPPLLRPYHLHWLQHDAKGLRVEKINALPLGEQ